MDVTSGWMRGWASGSKTDSTVRNNCPLGTSGSSSGGTPAESPLALCRFLGQILEHGYRGFHRSYDFIGQSHFLVGHDGFKVVVHGL